jgi:hypothetical protein
MAFPTGPTGSITLKDVCTAYGVSSDMNSLVGKVYYDSSANPFTVPSKNINLGMFKGNYYNTASGSFDVSTLQIASHKEYGPGSDVYTHVDIQSISYVINGPKLVSFQVTFFRGAGTTYLFSKNVGFNATSYSITVDGNQKYFTNDNSSTSFNTGVVSCNGSTLTLSFSMNASDDAGTQSSASGTWVFGISGNALTLTSQNVST